MTRIEKLSAAVALSFALGACATAPQDTPRLNQAQAKYERLEDDPDVARSGPVNLRNADDALRRAENQLAEGADAEVVDHHLYVAERYLDIAETQAHRARLQREVSAATERRRELDLEAQKMEAEAQRRRAEQQAEEAERLRRMMEELEAERTDRGMVMTLGDVLFDVDEATLKPGGLRTVGRLAEFMEEYPDRRVRIEGHTDSTGSAEYNQRLSERRAGAVRDALVDRGIASQRIETRGYGFDYPVASNDTPANRQRNRRVEIVISDAEGDITGR